MGVMYLVSGFSGSGKTYFCKTVMSSMNVRYFNIDDFYRTFNSDGSHNNEFEVWITFFQAIHAAAINNQDIIVETNALDYVDRQQFINWFPEFEAHHLIWIGAPYERALCNNNMRLRVIPENQMANMWKRIELPVKEKEKGWDSIRYFWNENNNGFEELDLDNFWIKYASF